MSGKSESDLSHLSEEEVNAILLPIPSDSSQSLLSIPSEEDGLGVRDEVKLKLASSIRQGIHTSTPAETGAGQVAGLDTQRLMSELEALSVSGPSNPESLTKEVGTKMKGLFQDFSSMLKLPNFLGEAGMNPNEEGAEPPKAEWYGDAGAFFSQAISKGTKWIESTATEFQNTVFPSEAEDEEAESSEETDDSVVALEPQNDCYEFNDYMIHMRGFGSLVLQSLTVPEDGNFFLRLRFQVKGELEEPSPVEKQYATTQLSGTTIRVQAILFKYGTENVTITLPAAEEDPKWAIKGPEDGFLIIEI